MSPPKVAPAEDGQVLFKKPIPCKTTGTPLTAWNETYLKRKKEVGEKFFTCQSGRKICYFTDGAPDPTRDDVAVALCVHGAAQSGLDWLMPEPLPGIFQIVPDRIGLGRSSTGPPSKSGEPGYSFAEICKELIELVDAVYADFKIPSEKKLFVAGHSMGGTITIELASCPEFRDRIEAIAPISAPCDCWRPGLTDSERKALKQIGFIMNSGKKGCCGGFNRWLLRKFSNAMFMRKAPDQPACALKDHGFAGYWKQMVSLAKTHTKDIVGDENALAAMESNPFFLCTHLDGNKSWVNPHDGFVEFQRCYAFPWSYDPKDVQVPCFLYTGEFEIHGQCGPPVAQQNQKFIGDNAQVIVFKGHGHLSIGLEYRRVLEALVKKEKVEKSCWEK